MDETGLNSWAMRTLVALGLACGGGVADADSVQLTTSSAGHSSWLAVNASDGVGTSNSTVTPINLPYNFTHAVTDDLTATSEATYTLNDSGFRIEFTQDRGARQPGASSSYAESWGFIYFTVDQEMSYLATGLYDANDTGGRNVLQARLLDKTTASTGILLDAYIDSVDVADETLTLESDPVIGGNFTGTLLPGRTYEFAFDVFTASRLDGAATGSGYLSLQLTPTAAPVPLPAAAWGGMALFGLIGAKRLRRKRADA